MWTRSWSQCHCSLGGSPQAHFLVVISKGLYLLHVCIVGSKNERGRRPIRMWEFASEYERIMMLKKDDALQTITQWGCRVLVAVEMAELTIFLEGEEDGGLSKKGGFSSREPLPSDSYGTNGEQFALYKAFSSILPSFLLSLHYLFIQQGPPSIPSPPNAQVERGNSAHSVAQAPQGVTAVHGMSGAQKKDQVRACTWIWECLVCMLHNV